MEYSIIQFKNIFEAYTICLTAYSGNIKQVHLTQTEGYETSVKSQRKRSHEADKRRKWS